MKVVIVDDNPADRFMLRDTLAEAGFEDVVTFASLRDAQTGLQEMMHTHFADIAFLDVQLPDGNGFDLCEWLKQEVSSFFPVVMLTGMDSPETRARASRSGADGHLSKPYHPDLLLAHLRRLLTRRLAVDSMVTVTRGIERLQQDGECIQDVQVGGYPVVRSLSWTGATSVHLVKDGDHTRVVKILARSALGSPTEEAFRRETACLAALSHPHLVSVIGHGELDGAPHCLMEFVDGHDLHRYVRIHGALTATEWQSVWQQATSALAYLHERGVVHRDIKPSNLFRAHSGHVKLGDFGVALAVGGDAAIAAGTPVYMAPEQFRNGRVHPSADVYSWGATAYQLATGPPPFAADSPMGLLHQHMSCQPPAIKRDELNPTLVSLVGCCLAKNPAERPSAVELAAAVAGSDIR